MRIGVLSLGATVNPPVGFIAGSSIPAPSVSQPLVSTGYTYGVDAAGDTLVCPPGYLYDAALKDCKGYAGSSVDVAAQTLQANIDVCISGGGTWDEGYLRCIPAPGSTPTGTIIQGVPNWAVYAVGGLLGLMLLMGGRR
jgi:hypothetical protein